MNGMSKAAQAADTEQSDREYIAQRQRREREDNTFSVQVIVRVVNRHGDVMNVRGNPSCLNRADRLEQEFTLATGAVGIEAAKHDFEVICNRVFQA